MATMKELEPILLDAIQQDVTCRCLGQRLAEGAARTVLLKHLNMHHEILDLWRSLPDPVTAPTAKLHETQRLGRIDARVLVFQKGYLTIKGARYLVWRYLCTGDEAAAEEERKKREADIFKPQYLGITETEEKI